MLLDLLENLDIFDKIRFTAAFDAFGNNDIDDIAYFRE